MSENDLGNLLTTIATTEGLEITKCAALYGGSINQVFFLQTTTGKKVIKLTHNSRFLDLFQAEKAGLEALKNSRTFAIPKVFSCGEIDNTAYLLLEYIPKGNPRADYWEYFAEKLAGLHRISNSYFGFSTSNYIGSLPQFNEKTSNAAKFYISQRLEPQFKLASKRGFTFGNLDVILKNIESEIPNEPPALIHGDLWNGNCVINQNGLPCLIDPAVCFGPREMDWP